MLAWMVDGIKKVNNKMSCEAGGADCPQLIWSVRFHKEYRM